MRYIYVVEDCYYPETFKLDIQVLKALMWKFEFCNSPKLKGTGKIEKHSISDLDGDEDSNLHEYILFVNQQLN